MSTYDDSLLAARFSALAVEPLPGDWTDVVVRADARKVRRPLRQRRRRLLVVLALVAFVAVVTASALAVRAFVVDDGFIGLPPAGATPSTPESGELVLAAYGIAAAGRTKVWAYADGRLISQLEGNGRDKPNPESANRWSSGFLEQRLTSDGVELLRSEIVSTDLFDDDKELRFGGQACLNFVQVRNGDPLVRVTWRGSHCPGPEGTLGTRTEGTLGTREQAKTLERLVERLADPGSWLPASAWEDREIRAYVPARYAISYGAVPQSMEASGILNLLPAPAEELLGAKDRVRTEGFYGLAGQMHAVYGYSSAVTTEEARTLAETLDEAGFKRSGAEYALAYTLDAPGTSGNVIDVTFEPMLPHGEATCSACG